MWFRRHIDSYLDLHSHTTFSTTYRALIYTAS